MGTAAGPPPGALSPTSYARLPSAPSRYALAISLAMLGAGGGGNLQLAWAYMVLRVLHSLVQALINTIEIRFALFVLSKIPLIALTVNAARIVI